MDLKLTGKTVFISGSTAGIGFATAKMFVEEGAHVILNGRTQRSVDDAIQKLEKVNPLGKVDGLVIDFANESEINAAIKHLPEVDILINNVGTYSSKSFFETTDQDWDFHNQINVMSGIRLSRAILPTMLSKDWGRIIFISSECASLVPEDLIAYSTTKAAMLAISRGLAQITSGSNVTVNTIMPGSTMTEGAKQFIENLAESKQQTVQQAEMDFFAFERSSSLLQRFAKVEEVASTILYYSSPLAAATNGACIKVDGGSTGGIM